MRSWREQSEYERQTNEPERILRLEQRLAELRAEKVALQQAVALIGVQAQAVLYPKSISQP